MLKPLGLAICLLVTPVVVASGCGSSKSTTTHTTATIPASTGATAGASATRTTSTPTTGTSAGKSPPAGQPGGKGAPSAAAVKRLPTYLRSIPPKQQRRFLEAGEVAHQAAEGRLSKQAAKAKREHIERELEAETFGKLGTEAIRHRVPSSRQFPNELQRTFVTSCTSTKKSIASCECLLAKFEEEKLERGARIADMVYTEARMRLHESLPPRIQRFIAECANAHA